MGQEPSTAVQVQDQHGQGGEGHEVSKVGTPSRDSPDPNTKTRHTRASDEQRTLPKQVDGEHIAIVKGARIDAKAAIKQVQQDNSCTIDLQTVFERKFGEDGMEPCRQQTQANFLPSS